MNIKLSVIIIAAVLVVSGAAAYLILREGDSIKPIDVDLEIFGNADKDWKIDENDALIVEEYIKARSEDDLEKLSELEERISLRFADANNDGSIDEADVEQIRRIAAGTADHLWFLDGVQKERDISLNKKRIGAEYFTNTEMMLILGQADKVVAIDNAPYQFREFYFSEGQRNNITNMVNMNEPDYDLVNGLNLDTLLVFSSTAKYEEKMNKLVGCDVLYLGLYTPDLTNTSKSNFIQGILKAGYIFGAVERAEGYTNWVLENRDRLLGIADSIEDSEKPVVGMSNYKPEQFFMNDENKILSLYRSHDPLGQAVTLAGGRNILEVIDEGGIGYAAPVQVDAVFNDDPNVHVDHFFLHMVKYTYGGTVNPGVPDHGYAVDDYTEIKNAWRIAVNHSLITDETITLIAGDFRNGCTGGVLLAAYMGKTINPDAYSDVDPIKMHNEYVQWMGIKDYRIGEKGVFVYTGP